MNRPYRVGKAKRAVHDPNGAYLSDGRKVGRYVEDPDGRLWLVKRIQPAAHRWQRRPGFSLDLGNFDELKARGGYGVRLVEPDDTCWETSAQTIDQNGERERDFGWGPQVRLDIAFWDCRSGAAHEQPHGGTSGFSGPEVYV